MLDVNFKDKKGVSLLYVIFVVSILLAISFGISGILISQIKMLGEIGYSVVAFYAADSGIEKVLIDRQCPCQDPCPLLCPPLCREEDCPCQYPYEGSLPNGSTYQAFVTEGGATEDCPGGEYCDPEETPCFYYCIKSIGTYENTKRAIEINY